MNHQEAQADERERPPVSATTVVAIDQPRSESNAQTALVFPRDLRCLFVQMLFSLTAAEIARQFADLVLHVPVEWNSSPAYSHLLLAGVVVVSSWVGWAASSARSSVPFNGVFSGACLILFMDIFLVFLYFTLTQSAEVPRGAPGGPRPDLVPSSSDEVMFVSMILAIYFAWDVLTKAFVNVECDKGKLIERVCGACLWSRGWISCACMILGFIVAYVLKDVKNTTGVVLADLSLLSLVLFFRSLKEKKHRWSTILLVGVLACCCASLRFS